VGVKRALARKGDRTIFDEMDMDFHHKIREGLKKGRTVIDPHFAFVEIDASLSENELVKKAREVLDI
jgi:thymidylate kinase